MDSQVTADDVAAYRNNYKDCYQFVVDTFKDYANVKIVRGVVPEVLSSVRIDKVAYLSIDMSCTFPEIAALQYFWPKMVKGGIIILDDYGFPGHEAQQLGADDFAASVNTKVLCLATGQGVIIKH